MNCRAYIDRTGQSAGAGRLIGDPPSMGGEDESKTVGSGDGEAAAAVAEGQRRGEEEGSAEAAETIAKSEAAAGRGRSEWEHDALFAAFSKFDRDSRCVNNTEL